MIRRCVRCGRNDQAEGTFLCTPCLDDPRAYIERSDAELRAALEGRPARRIVVERYQWAGGWSGERRRDRA